MHFLLAALILFFSIQEQELKTSFEVIMVSTFSAGVTDVIEVTPYQMMRVKDSWRIEAGLPLMINLSSNETEYLYELVTSEEFKQVESPSTYECADSEIKESSVNLFVTVVEVGGKSSKDFSFNCLCRETDAPEVLCNIQDSINRLDIEHIQR